MSQVGEYLLSVIAVALIISISNTLTTSKGVIASLAKLVSGLVLIAVIVSPWRDLRLTNFGDYFFLTEADAISIVSEGESVARTEVLSYIKKHLEAYILDKASELSLVISVDVSLLDDSAPSVQSIVISGSASPYARGRLTQLICKEFDISEDQIIWT